MTPLHIAVDGSGLSRPLAGVGSYTREILRAMTSQRPLQRLTVYLPRDAQPLDELSVAWRRIPATRLVGRHLNWPRHLRRQAAGAYFGPAGQLPLGRLGSPSVITVHDLAIYREPAWFPSGQFLSTRLVVPRSLRRADRLLAVSHRTAADLGEIFGIEEGRIRVVHHGVSERFQPQTAERRQEASRRLGLPERFILFVGTIEPRKNLETLLEAWALLARRPPLVVAGDWGWRHESIQARVGRLGPDLKLLGPVLPNDLVDLYNLATCLAHPAWYEGFGLTPLEAMACGTPVICSDAASLPEVVGDAGLLLPPADVQAWSRALQRVLEDPGLASDLRRRGILRAAEFSWERSARLTWNAIDEVMA